MTRVFVAQHPTEAHILKGALESKGISIEIRGEALFGAGGEIPLSETYPEIWVLDDDKVDDALGVLRDRLAESVTNASGESWRCSNCGESVEPQFTTCWQCSSDKPDPWCE